MGGGGAFVRLTAAPGAQAALTDACFGAGAWLFDVAAPGLNQAAQANMNFALKAPPWAYPNPSPHPHQSSFTLTLTLTLTPTLTLTLNLTRWAAAAHSCVSRRPRAPKPR